MTFEPNPYRMVFLALGCGAGWFLWNQCPVHPLAWLNWGRFSGHEQLVAFAMVVIAAVGIVKMLLR